MRCGVSLNASFRLTCRNVPFLTRLPSSLVSKEVIGRTFTSAQSDHIGKVHAILRGLDSHYQTPQSQLVHRTGLFWQPPTICAPTRKRTTSAVSGGRNMPPPLAAVLPGGGRVLSIQSHTVSVRHQSTPYKLLIEHVLGCYEAARAVPVQYLIRFNVLM